MICQADFPPDEIDLAMLPFTAAGQAELTREWLQQAHQALALGGRLLAATDNPRDTWLGGQLQRLCDRVSRRADDRAALYLAVKTRPLKKVKDFSCEFAFRDRGRLIRAVSRPGVFAHRRVNPGARALLEVMEVAPGDRVFDMGCGSGVAALAAAMRADGVSVYALDSNPRAVQCTLQGAALNGQENIAARLDAEGTCDLPGSSTCSWPIRPTTPTTASPRSFSTPAAARCVPAARSSWSPNVRTGTWRPCPRGWSRDRRAGQGLPGNFGGAAG